MQKNSRLTNRAGHRSAQALRGRHRGRCKRHERRHSQRVVAVRHFQRRAENSIERYCRQDGMHEDTASDASNVQRQELYEQARTENVCADEREVLWHRKKGRIASPYQLRRSSVVGHCARRRRAAAASANGGCRWRYAERQAQRRGRGGAEPARHALPVRSDAAGRQRSRRSLHGRQQDETRYGRRQFVPQRNDVPYPIEKSKIKKFASTRAARSLCSAARRACRRRRCRRRCSRARGGGGCGAVAAATRPPRFRTPPPATCWR